MLVGGFRTGPDDFGPDRSLSKAPPTPSLGISDPWISTGPRRFAVRALAHPTALADIADRRSKASPWRRCGGRGVGALVAGCLGNSRSRVPLRSVRWCLRSVGPIPYRVRSGRPCPGGWAHVARVRGGARALSVNTWTEIAVCCRSWRDRRVAHRGVAHHRGRGCGGLCSGRLGRRGLRADSGTWGRAAAATGIGVVRGCGLLSPWAGRGAAGALGWSGHAVFCPAGPFVTPAPSPRRPQDRRGWVRVGAVRGGRGWRRGRSLFMSLCGLV